MSENIHREFLRMLGWEGDALESFLPDWLGAAAFLGLTDDDVRYSVTDWIPTYWDLSLRGIRLCIGACIREIAETAKLGRHLTEGKRLLYSNMPASPVCIRANKLAGGGQLHISYPDFLISTVLSAFFNKTYGGTQAGSCMDPVCRHCGMNCVRADASRDGTIPPPTVTWNWGLHCNEAPKTEELIGCLKGTDWHDVFITLPHDAPLGDVEADDMERVRYLAEEIRIGQRQVTAFTGIEVGPGDLSAAMADYLGYLRRLERLSDMVVTADPQPITGNELTLFGICLQMVFDTGYDYLNEAIDTVTEEAAERIARGCGSLPKGAPKLACHFNPLNVPWVDKAFRDNGVSLSVGRIFPLAGTMSRYLDGGDIYVAIARQCLATPDAVNMRDEARIVSELLSRYPVDGALYGFFAFDRWVGALQKTMIQIVEESTGIPHFYLEGDFWDGTRCGLEDRMAIVRSICNCLKISGIA